MKKYENVPDEQLIRRLRDGEAAITDFIMDKYKFMVKKQARAMYLLGGENEDLIQEGMIGLFKAVRDYDLEQGASFSSFAELCISRQMYTAIKLSQRQKHMPLNSYVSLYEKGSEVEEGKQTQLIDQLQPIKENNPEELSKSGMEPKEDSVFERGDFYLTNAEIAMVEKVKSAMLNCRTTPLQ